MLDFAHKNFELEYELMPLKKHFFLIEYKDCVSLRVSKLTANPLNICIIIFH